MFSLSESVQSTRIEGTQVTFADMFEIDNKKNWERQEVNNYLTALQIGADRISEGMPFSSRLICELHRTLMQNARGSISGSGEFRAGQNFLGPDSNIDHAVYMPVSANKISDYMTNLEYYMNGIPHHSFLQYQDKDLFVLGESALPLFKIAVMHAQFESIHPFWDGNGRVGRILIALMSMKYGLVNKPIFLVSEALEQQRMQYYASLNKGRGNDPNWIEWLHLFIRSAKVTAERLINKMQSASILFSDGLKQCGLESERKVWAASFDQLILNSNEAAEQTGLNIATARHALNSLVSKKLLNVDAQKVRNRRYFNYQLSNVLQGFPN